MKIGIVLNTKDQEEAWNAFRFGIKSLEKGHGVTVFLMNKGTECEGIKSGKFNINEKMTEFTKNNGKILTCGTCLKLRNKTGTKLCPVSSMDELIKLVEESDKVISFG